MGVAISDRTNMIASPIKVIRFKDIANSVAEIVEIILKNEITDVVIGLPKNMDGTLGFASKRSEDFSKFLETKVDVKIHFVDERLTSVQAENILINRDYSRESRKKIIDEVAAVLILESFLNMKGDKNERK